VAAEHHDLIALVVPGISDTVLYPFPFRYTLLAM